MANFSMAEVDALSKRRKSGWFTFHRMTERNTDEG